MASITKSEFGRNQFRHILRRDELPHGMNLDPWIYSPEPVGEKLDFGTANILRGGNQLPVDVGLRHAVRIDHRDAPHAGTDEDLGRITAHPPTPTTVTCAAPRRATASSPRSVAVRLCHSGINIPLAEPAPFESGLGDRRLYSGSSLGILRKSVNFKHLVGRFEIETPPRIGKLFPEDR